MYENNKARQNRILPSVTAKTCCASFPARAERGEVLRQTPKHNILPPAAKRGENHSGACWVFPSLPHLKNKTAVLLAFKNYRPSYFLGYRQRPILPGRFQPSTFGAKRLNFCVRNGNRWVPLAIVTGMVGCVLHTHNYTAQSIDALFRSLFLRFCDQALDLLVSVSSMHYCTYTPDLSTL